MNALGWVQRSSSEFLCYLVDQAFAPDAETIVMVFLFLFLAEEILRLMVEFEEWQWRRRAQHLEEELADLQNCIQKKMEAWKEEDAQLGILLRRCGDDGGALTGGWSSALEEGFEAPPA